MKLKELIEEIIEKFDLEYLNEDEIKIFYKETFNSCLIKEVSESMIEYNVKLNGKEFHYFKNKEGITFGFVIKELDNKYQKGFHITNIGNSYMYSEIREKSLNLIKDIIDYFRSKKGFKSEFYYYVKEDVISDNEEYEDWLTKYVLHIERFNDFEDFLSTMKTNGKKKKWFNMSVRKYREGEFENHKTTKEELNEVFDESCKSFNERNEQSSFDKDYYYDTRTPFIEMQEKGLLNTFVLKHEGNLIAKAITVIDEDTKSFLYLSGFYRYDNDVNALKMNLFGMIDYCFQHGIKTVDMLEGDYGYKKKFLCTGYKVKQL